MAPAGPILLLVEDDPTTRRILTRLLLKLGRAVLAVATVREAMDALDPVPSVIVLDLDLPDGRGEAILRHVREHRLHARVVVCSACGDPQRLEDLHRLAPDAYLPKPIEFPQLLDACRVEG
jgi:CheY-like chemotaxis protein